MITRQTVSREAMPAVLTKPDIEAQADRLGISWRSVQRLQREGLIAHPEQVGAGRGRGKRYRYPARVQDQLAAVATARGWRRRPARLRHWVWWEYGHLERWSMWREDRAQTFATWARGDTVSEPDEVEREALTWIHDRHQRFPRKRLPNKADQLTFACQMLELVRIPQMPHVVLDVDSQREAASFMLAYLKEPLDSMDDGAITFGELLARGAGVQRPKNAGPTWWLPAAICQSVVVLLPDGRGGVSTDCFPSGGRGCGNAGTRARRCPMDSPSDSPARTARGVSPSPADS